MDHEFTAIISSILFGSFFYLLFLLLSVKKNVRIYIFYFWSPHENKEASAMLSFLLFSPQTKAMVGSRSLIGGLFNRLSIKRNEKFIDYPLTPIQEALRALWHIAFPNVALKGLISEQWKEMGWQGPNPSTDFRGCGFIALENLLFFGRTYPASFHRLLFKQGGTRATWEYPFAVAGINVSFMLIQMLDLYSAKPKNLPGFNFLKLLGEDEEAFDVLYCIAFEMMEAQWLAMHASYMKFNEVLQATRTQLQRELSLDDVHRIQDLPAYNLLYL
ncbi:ELMO domain-containing protein A-like isoform X3 [Durio zibethinus]|uniref:ELMO domain-containing protein A-like isoform X3 n=1 Tax=Durio zibethinus TaxID=66656 RepID=A0A6P5XF93_DURZI|nr:ELMO domain-containing protein A-like isoform X3 [Durio zibethinus]